MELSKIRKKLQKTLDEKRYEHTLGVAYTAAILAELYDEDPGRAYMAGLLHDCAKCIPNDDKIKICKKAGLDISEVEYHNPFLLHSKCGSVVAKKEYEVEDPEILSAIASHTTGKPEMTTLEKIVFIADYIEPWRRQADNLSLVRRLAYHDLDAALIQILSDTLIHLEKSGMEIDPMTKCTYDYYIDIGEE